MVLADFGADVVKVEPPGGDRFRSLPGSPLWLRGKRSVALDLHTPAGCSQLRALVSGADVVVVSGPPGRAARWGIDASGAELLQPSIIHCSITGWGETGTLAAVKNTTAPFLQYLDKVGLQLGALVEVLDKVAFDNSFELSINRERTALISAEVSRNLFVTK